MGVSHQRRTLSNRRRSSRGRGQKKKKGMSEKSEVATESTQNEVLRREGTAEEPTQSPPCWTCCLKGWINFLGTESAHSGRYNSFHPDEGHFVCRACRVPVYSAEAKLSAHCGWPAFDRCYKGSVVTKADRSHGMLRTEILCGRCGTHFGHVFVGEAMSETNQRHCVNSHALVYVRPITGTSGTASSRALPSEATLAL